LGSVVAPFLKSRRGTQLESIPIPIPTPTPKGVGNKQIVNHRLQAARTSRPPETETGQQLSGIENALESPLQSHIQKFMQVDANL
jgi:hypothetical protein